MPCILCEEYFQKNPCHNIEEVPLLMRNGVMMKWYQHLHKNCPCKDCIVTAMCDRTSSSRCSLYQRALLNKNESS